MNILYAISTKSDLERKTFCVKIAVDLLVRSWVEIVDGSFKHGQGACRPPREVVSWNRRSIDQLVFRCVDLLVRSWVEISLLTIPCGDCLVDLLVRSWVEIFFSLYANTSLIRRPPREVVSWNGNGASYISQTKMSTSSWGRELKCQKRSFWYILVRRPPREVVSWNILLAICNIDSIVDLLVRSWVEIFIASFNSLLL